MAVTKAGKASTKEEEVMEVASMNPDEMLAGGLMDDFDGEITDAVFTAWDYEGKLDHHILAVALTILPEGEDEPFIQNYSAGDLDQFVPSLDGKKACDLNSDDQDDWRGPFAKKVGQKAQLNNNSNWAQFLGALIDADFDRSKFSPNIREALTGTYGHFNRIPQKKRSGIQANATGGDNNQRRNRNNDILVITELKEKPASGKSTKAAGTKASTAKAADKPKPGAKKEEAAASSGGSLDDRLREIVTEAVLEAGEEGFEKSGLAKLVMGKLSGAEKAKGVKRVGETEFLESSDTWVYDADEAKLLSTAG